MTRDAKVYMKLSFEVFLGINITVLGTKFASQIFLRLNIKTILQDFYAIFITCWHFEMDHSSLKLLANCRQQLALSSSTSVVVTI